MPAKRVEQYQKADGTWSSWRRIYGHKVNVHEFRMALEATKLNTALLKYAFGTAQHETGFVTNERDTEINGFQSWGIFQISKQEAADVGFLNANLLSLKDSVDVFVRLTFRNEQAVQAALKERGDDIRPGAHFDFYAYVAIVHNQGRKAAHDTILKYGLDWVEYKRRNPALPIVSHRYGDDVISGGPFYPKST